MNHTTELLAPAGGPEAGYAALHFGADAVYLGLQRFSARAEADNFSPESLSEFAAYAHSLAPRRNVYLTLNTLITDAELAAAAETLAQAVTCGVDAVIVQDIGIAALARRWFPQLALHASTQMAIHNLPGVLAAADLGFRRVTLARELGLDEIAAIAAAVPIEIETFIHGTLCYSYSGLCMFSSLATGRSGNRGKCVYSCREAVAVPGAGKAHPFSLKDLALTDQALDLASAGVRSLKIEGRKKSPLYVAATVDYYRRLLDGTLCADDQGQVEARLKTIFARPWTKFFLTRRRNPDAADPDVVGHRGAPLGTIGQAAKTPAGYGVHFIPALAVERHDGIQIDIPGESKPYGFPVDSLFARQGNKLQSVFRIEAGQPAAVALPADAPPLSPGLSLYLSSSQEVKRSYPYAKPKPGAYRHRLAAVVEIALNSDPSGAIREDGVQQITISCDASAQTQAGPVSFSTTISADAYPARDPAGAEAAVQTAFARTGNSWFEFRIASFASSARAYCKPGVWNALRRTVIEGLEQQYRQACSAWLDKITASLLPTEPMPAGRIKQPADADSAGNGDFRWSIHVDAIEWLKDLERDDFAGCDDIIIQPDFHDTTDAILTRLAVLEERAGGDRIRLSLPVILRSGWESVAKQVDMLIDRGWKRWMIPGLAGWQWLKGRGIDISADWPLYTLNRSAAGMLETMGLSSFTISPEDFRINTSSLLAEYPSTATMLVYADIPLFISAACAHSHLGLSRSKAGADCGNHPLTVIMERYGKLEMVPTRCGTVVLGKPYTPVASLAEAYQIGAQQLRVEFRWRDYSPLQVAKTWRSIRRGDIPEGIRGNFDRGLF